MAEETNPDAEGMDEDLADEWAAAMSEAGDAEGSEIIIGDNIIIPMAIKTLATTISTMRNGINNMKPI